MTDNILSKLFNILIFYSIILLPFAWILPGRPSDGQLIFFMVIGILVVSRQIKNTWIKLFSIHISLWIVFASLLHLFNPGNLRTVELAFYTTNQAIYIFFGFSLILWIQNTQLKKEWFYNAICILTVIQCLIAIPQQFGIFPFVWVMNFAIPTPNPSDSLAVGTFENGNFFAAYLAMSIPFFFRKYWNYFIPVIVTHLLLSTTTTAVISAIVGVMVLHNFNRYIVSSLILSGFIYTYLDGSFTKLCEINSDNSYRLTMWQTCISNIKGLPGLTFGHGLGTLWGERWLLHNEWLQCIYELGIIGFTFVVGFTVTVYRQNRMLFAAFCAACVNCLGNYPLHLPPSALLIIMIIGLLEREKLNEGAYQV